MKRCVFVALVVCLAACNGKKKEATVPPVGGDAGAIVVNGDPAACEAHTDKISALYRTDAGDPPEDADQKARYEEAIADNTHLVLADCRTSPARFAPCIESATSVAFLETSCVIPLDEAGTVEGVTFGNK